MAENKSELEFVELIKQNRNFIYKVCNAYATDRYELADLYQDVVLNLWESFPKYRKQSKISTWIYRIALNTAISALHKQHFETTLIPITSDMENLIDSTTEIKTQIVEMYAIIRQLNKLERALIILWLDGISYQEIAQILGITRTNVATKLNRVKEKLAQMANS